MFGVAGAGTPRAEDERKVGRLGGEAATGGGYGLAGYGWRLRLAVTVGGVGR